MRRKSDTPTFQNFFKTKIKIIQRDERKKYVKNNTKQAETRQNKSM